MYFQKHILYYSTSCEFSEQYYSILANIENIIECSISNKINTQKLLLKQGDIEISCDFNLNVNAFNEVYVSKYTARKQLEVANNIIKSSILLSDTQSQQLLVFYSALNSKGLIHHSIDCGYYWKDNRKNI